MKSNVTIFDREYPREKQAEGIAISEAVAYGKCDKCAFLNQCQADSSFEFPVFAWCHQRKHQILKEWERNGS